MMPKRYSLQSKYKHRLKRKRWKNTYHTIENEKKAGIAIPRQNRLETKTLRRDKEGHCIMIKGSIQQENIILVNIHAPNVGSPKHVNIY